MAVVGIGDLSLYVTGKPAADLSDPERSRMADLCAWANALVDRYSGDDAPEEIKAAAVRRVAYYDHHTRLSRQPPGETLHVRFRRDAPLGPLRASGALSLLSPWKRRGVGVSA